MDLRKRKRGRPKVGKHQKKYKWHGFLYRRKRGLKLSNQKKKSYKS